MRTLWPALLPACLGLAACSGGGSSGSATPRTVPTQPGPAASAIPQITASVSVSIASIPAGVQSIAVALLGSPSPLVLENVSAASPGCKGAGNVLTCTVTFTAPVGPHEFAFTAFGAPAGQGAILAAGDLALTIAPGAATYPVTLGGIEKTLGLTLSDPNPLEGQSESVTLFVAAYDVNGAQIVGSGAEPLGIGLSVGSPPGGYVAAPAPVPASLTFPSQASASLAYGGAHAQGAYRASFASYASQPVTLRSVPPPVATPGTLTLTPGQSLGFTVSEGGYSGLLSAGSSAPTVATVMAGSTAGAFTVKGVSGGLATITVTDSYGHSTTVAVTVNNTGVPVKVPPYAIVLNPSAVTFTILGQTQAFGASEQGYSGSFTAVSANPSITSVSPAGGATTFLTKAVAAGSTAITVKDSHGNAATFSTSLGNGSIPITIPASFTAVPAALEFTGGGQTLTFVAHETGFSGSFNANSDTPSVATVTNFSTSQFTVTAAGAPGTANITVTDGRGNSVTVTVGVTITTVPIT